MSQQDLDFKCKQPLQIKVTSSASVRNTAGLCTCVLNAHLCSENRVEQQGIPTPPPTCAAQLLRIASHVMKQMLVFTYCYGGSQLALLGIVFLISYLCFESMGIQTRLGITQYTSSTSLSCDSQQLPGCSLCKCADRSRPSPAVLSLSRDKGCPLS